MEGFFKGVPESPGVAFVIVTHLSPERKSLLHEVLERYTNLPVMVAEDGPDAHLTPQQGLAVGMVVH